MGHRHETVFHRLPAERGLAGGVERFRGLSFLRTRRENLRCPRSWMISCVIQSCVFTCETSFAPAFAMASFAPVDSRCQCVLMTFVTLPVSLRTSCACAASPQSTRRFPPSPASATMLFPAPVISVTLSVSFGRGRLRARLSQRSAGQAKPGSAGGQGPKEFASLWVHHGQYCSADRSSMGADCKAHVAGSGTTEWQYLIRLKKGIHFKQI